MCHIRGAHRRWHSLLPTMVTGRRWREFDGHMFDLCWENLEFFLLHDLFDFFSGIVLTINNCLNNSTKVSVNYEERNLVSHSFRWMLLSNVAGVVLFTYMFCLIGSDCSISQCMVLLQLFTQVRSCLNLFSRTLISPLWEYSQNSIKLESKR